MKKYCFLPTGNEVWLNVAIELYKNKIAKPVFWLGDDIHLQKARKYFGKGVFIRDDFVHYQSNIISNKYDGQFIEFFKSPNFLRSKDRCLKMMDRLDTYGLFNRLDREVVFNKLCIWLLKEFSKTKPEFLIMSEFAHSHAQYLVYEICDFLGLKIAKFNDWGSITPMLFLQEVKTGKRYKVNFSFPKEIKNKLNDDIKNHLYKVFNLKANENYLPAYLRTNWKYNSFRKGNFIYFFKNSLYNLKLNIFQIRKILSKSYYKVNPYKLNFLQLNFVYRRRKNALKNYCNKNAIKPNLNSRFVYFALHFEPERTTNPDGGFFHDQFLAIIHLRKILPEDVNIFVKEHPSQFKIIDRGLKGRSPLFYEMIKNINNVFLVDIKTDNYLLTKNSLFVSTITGTAAREAAIMGKKALIFGDAWFNECPNVFRWNSKLTFQKIMDKKISNKDDIFDYLSNQMVKFSIPGCQNPSSQKVFLNYLNDEFLQSEFEGIYKLMNMFFESKN